MKFEVESEPFVKMIQMLSESVSGHQGVLWVVASQGHVHVESRTIAAEMDAHIAEEGQCTVPPAQVLRALRDPGTGRTLSVEANASGMHLGPHTITVNSYRPEAEPVCAPQVFFASDWGLVHPA